MGTYTEFHFNVELKEDVPEGVLRVLRYMLLVEDDKRQDIPDLPDHLLFKCDRWTWMLLCDSYYFSADTVSTLRYDGIGRCWMLCIRCNLKNYSNEIEHFVSWITPYLYSEEGDFLGFCRCETTQIPTLIFHPNRFITPEIHVT